MTDHIERKHAACSPSTLKSRAICPSWEGIKDAPLHPVTEQGIRCHEAMETGDLSILLSEEEVALTRMCEDYLADLTAGKNPDFELKEPKLHTHESSVYGFADVVLVFGDHADLVDFKFGWNFQGDAKTNLQGIAYAIGVFEKYPQVTEVTVHFLYPRIDSISEHTFYRDRDLQSMKLDVSVVAERFAQAEENKRQVHPSMNYFVRDPDNCTWCGYKARCPAVLSMAMTLATNMDDSAELALVDPRNIKDPREMALALRWAPVMEEWAKSVKQWALVMRMEDGVEVPGYDLRERKGKLVVKNPVAAHRIATKEYGVSEEEFVSCCTVSAAQLAAKAGEHGGPRMKKKTDNLFREQLAEEGVAVEGDPVPYLARDKKFDFSALALPEKQVTKVKA